MSWGSYRLAYYRGGEYRYADIGMLDGKKVSVVLLRGDELFISPFSPRRGSRIKKIITIPNIKMVRCLDIDRDGKDEILLLGPYGVGVVKGRRLVTRPLILFPEETIGMATTIYGSEPSIVVSTKNNIYVVDSNGRIRFRTYAYNKYITNIGDFVCVIERVGSLSLINQIISFQRGKVNVANLIGLETNALICDCLLYTSPSPRDRG